MNNPLRDIPSQARVMVDANILVYALFSEFPQYLIAKDFITRGARKELKLYVSAHSVSDIIHRAMVLEAVGQGITQQTANYLKQHPQFVRQLKRYKTVLRELSIAQITILSMTYQDLHTSKKYRDQYGILANDSLILAVMEQEKITNLATNDPDFARVPDIAVWQPE
jgi:predicted nucleic acid-binding protein